MKRPDTRIAELEQKLERLEREGSRFDVRRPNQKSLKQGWWIGTLDAQLNQGSTATVSIRIYSGGVLTDTTLNVTGRDVTLGTGDSIAAGTKIQVRWYHNTWLVIPIAGAPAGTGTPFYNDSGEAIPPYAIMFIAGDTRTISGTRYLEVGKPGSPVATFDIHWLVNGADTIPAATIANDPAATGLGNWLSETDGGTVAVGQSVNVGDEFGPKPGSWYGWKGRPGFTALEGSYTDGSSNVVVAAKQRDVVRVFGRMYSTLTQNAAGNATAQFEIWHRNTSGSRYPAGWSNLTVYGTLMNVGDTAPAGTMGYADYSTIGTGIWEVDPACDPDNTNSAYPPGQSANFQAFEEFQFSGDDSPTSTPSYAANH